MQIGILQKGWSVVKPWNAPKDNFTKPGGVRPEKGKLAIIQYTQNNSILQHTGFILLMLQGTPPTRQSIRGSERYRPTDLLRSKAEIGSHRSLQSKLASCPPAAPLSIFSVSPDGVCESHWFLCPSNSSWLSAGFILSSYTKQRSQLLFQSLPNRRWLEPRQIHCRGWPGVEIHAHPPGPQNVMELGAAWC